MNSIVALTTHERAEWFRAALGIDADFRFDFKKTWPLKDLLANVRLAGGSIVVLDEEHFPSTDEMLADIESYVNDAHQQDGSVRLIVVCSKRFANDRVLSHLAGYCHIYDLLYGVDGVDIVEPLRKLVESPRSRADVVSLLGGLRESPYEPSWQNTGGQNEETSFTGRKEEPDPLAITDIARVLRPGQRILLEVIVR